MFPGEHFSNLAEKQDQESKQTSNKSTSKIVELDSDTDSEVKPYKSKNTSGSVHQSNSKTVYTKSPTGGADMSVRSSTNPHQPTADDERRMQEILSNPEIRNILSDQKIFGMIEALRSNPTEGQR